MEPAGDKVSSNHLLHIALKYEGTLRLHPTVVNGCVLRHSFAIPAPLVNALQDFFSSHRCIWCNPWNIQRRRFHRFRCQNKTPSVPTLDPHRPITARLFKDRGEILSSL